MTQTYTADWFDRHAPNWNRWLADFKGRPGLRALEIGSYEGRSAVWLLQNVLTDPSCVIECADLFDGDYLANFRANTAPWSGQVVEHHGRSFDALRTAQGPFDIVYIDGSHWAPDVLTDALMAWPLLKTGGVMIFDDYNWLSPEMEAQEPGPVMLWLMRTVGYHWRRASIRQAGPRTPKLAVDCLLKVLEGRYELLGLEYQVAVRKLR